MEGWIPGTSYSNFFYNVTPLMISFCYYLLVNSFPFQTLFKFHLIQVDFIINQLVITFPISLLAFYTITLYCSFCLKIISVYIFLHHQVTTKYLYFIFSACNPCSIMDEYFDLQLNESWLGSPQQCLGTVTISICTMVCAFKYFIAFFPYYFIKVKGK